MQNNSTSFQELKYGKYVKTFMIKNKFHHLILSNLLMLIGKQTNSNLKVLFRSLNNYLKDKDN